MGGLSGRLAAVGLMVMTAFTLAVGFWIKDRCTTHVWDGYQYRTSCYNDIYALHPARGLDRGQFPYVHGNGEGPPPGLHVDPDGDLEYPVGTGVFMGLVASAVRGGQAFFRANALGLAIAGLIMMWLLIQIADERRRVLFVALGSPLALYAFHNWDLLAVMLMIAGLYAFHRRGATASGALLGIGTATKLFPGAIVPGIAFSLARTGRRWRVPWRFLLAAAAGFVVVNLPILVINPQGWLYPWRFQSTRFPNFETSWYMIFRHLSGGGASADSFWWRTYPEMTGILSGVLFLVGLAVLLLVESRRERIRPYALAFGALLIFLLTAKVYSPQFALWLLPFFALLRIPWPAYVAFIVSDAAVWVGISAWFLTQPGDGSFRFMLLEIAVWGRYAVLAWLLWLSRRVDENVVPVFDPAADAEASLQSPA